MRTNGDADSSLDSVPATRRDAFINGLPSAATSAIAVPSAHVSAWFGDHSTSSRASSQHDRSSMSVLSAVVLASALGVVVGWHGRAWRNDAQRRTFLKQEMRRRHPLWLLPSPSPLPTSLLLRDWAAAFIGLPRAARVLWSPALLRLYSVQQPTSTSVFAFLWFLAKRSGSRGGEGDTASLKMEEAKVVRRDEVRWGTRMLAQLHGSHTHGPLENDLPLQKASTLVNTEGSLSLRAALTPRPYQWEGLPSHAVDVFDATKDNSLLSAPLRVLPRHSFTLLYDPITRLSVWCGYHLTRASAERARRQRRCLVMYTDRSLEKSARRVPAEVKRRGYDRGHLAPHASVAATPQSALEASLLSNIHLQHRALNRGAWRWLESATRAYVRIPYTFAERESTGGVAAGVRKDGLLLLRLLREQTPYTSTVDSRRVAGRDKTMRSAKGEATAVAAAAGAAGGGGDGGRHLCVNVGPVYYSTRNPAGTTTTQATGHRTDVTTSTGVCTVAPQRCGRPRRKATHQASAKSRCLLTTTAAPTQHRRRTRTAPAMIRSAARTRKADKDEVSALTPDAFFLSLWDAHTNHHLHLVLPNTPDTPEMHCLTRALSDYTKAGSATLTSAPLLATNNTTTKRRRGRPRVHPRTTTAAASADLSGAVGEEALVTALQPFMVSTEKMESLLEQSMVEVRTRWARVRHPELLINASTTTTTTTTTATTVTTCMAENARPCADVKSVVAAEEQQQQRQHSALALRAPLRLFPVYRERWVWQTRWQRLGSRVAPNVLWFKEKSKPVPALH